MQTDSKTLSNLVDLLHNREARYQRRLDFEREALPKPALAPVTPFRRLTEHEVAHRRQMVRHLATAKPQA